MLQTRKLFCSDRFAHLVFTNNKIFPPPVSKSEMQGPWLLVSRWLETVLSEAAKTDACLLFCDSTFKLFQFVDNIT